MDIFDCYILINNSIRYQRVTKQLRCELALFPNILILCFEIHNHRDDFVISYLINNEILNSQYISRMVVFPESSVPSLSQGKNIVKSEIVSFGPSISKRTQAHTHLIMSKYFANVNSLYKFRKGVMVYILLWYH